MQSINKIKDRLKFAQNSPDLKLLNKISEDIFKQLEKHIFTKNMDNKVCAMTFQYYKRISDLYTRIKKNSKIIDKKINIWSQHPNVVKRL